MKNTSRTCSESHMNLNLIHLRKICGTHGVHVDQPARFLPGLLHPVKAEAGVHVVGELAALQPLERRHGGSIIPDSNTQQHYCHNFFKVACFSGMSSLDLRQRSVGNLLVFVVRSTLAPVRFVPSAVLQNHLPSFVSNQLKPEPLRLKDFSHIGEL